MPMREHSAAKFSKEFGSGHDYDPGGYPYTVPAGGAPKGGKEAGVAAPENLAKVAAYLEAAAIAMRGLTNGGAERPRRNGGAAKQENHLKETDNAVPAPSLNVLKSDGSQAASDIFGSLLIQNLKDKDGREAKAAADAKTAEQDKREKLNTMFKKERAATDEIGREAAGKLAEAGAPPDFVLNFGPVVEESYNIYTRGTPSKKPRREVKGAPYTASKERIQSRRQKRIDMADYKEARERKSPAKWLKRWRHEAGSDKHDKGRDIYESYGDNAGRRLEGWLVSTAPGDDGLTRTTFITREYGLLTMAKPHWDMLRYRAHDGQLSGRGYVKENEYAYPETSIIGSRSFQYDPVSNVFAMDAPQPAGARTRAYRETFTGSPGKEPEIPGPVGIYKYGDQPGNPAAKDLQFGIAEERRRKDDISAILRRYGVDNPAAVS